ncbi:f-box protein [Stylonychia lemnae]|uniref:F-box protein n=1 Tax=Stylonychia lemnae TaxID=5949 RepID=A0A077ZW28_STYLE|nr:f-box protein [Stylonychia lemnae]|eukprot:CDW72651.1 f-box protein [Stylonychia lemnae]
MSQSDFMVQIDVKYQCSKGCDKQLEINSFRNGDPHDFILETVSTNDGDNAEMAFAWTPCLSNITDNLTLQIRNLRESVNVKVAYQLLQIQQFSFACSYSILQPESRQFHGFTYQQNGDAWLFGGINNKNQTLGDFWKLDTDSMSWEHISQTQIDSSKITFESFPEARYGHIMETYYDYIILFGGINQKSQWQNIKTQKSQISANKVAYASGKVAEQEGQLYILCGKTTNGPTNEVWRLDLEKVIQYVENPLRHLNKTQIWSQIALETPLRSRYGQQSEFIFPNTILVMGGIGENQENIQEIQQIQLNELKVYSVKKKFSGEFPEPRAFTDMTHISGGMLVLYGGQNSQNQIFNDYWHLKLDIQNHQIEAFQIQQEDYLTPIGKALQIRLTPQIIIQKNQDLPIIYGSSRPQYYFDSSDLLMVKDQRCISTQEQESLNCIPCGIGSQLNNKTCQPCDLNSYWVFDQQVGSRCEICPDGTERSQNQVFGCDPCQAGFFYKNSTVRCKACKLDEICPIASATAFPENLEPEFQKITHRNDPPLYQNTSQMIGTCVFFNQRKTIRRLYTWDFIPITSGTKQNFVGGIITVLYSMTIIILVSGIIIKYLFFNKRIEGTQLAGFEKTKDILVSYQLSLQLYASQYSERPFDICDLSQSYLNLTSSYHYETAKMKIKCTQQSYDPLGKIGQKRVKAQSLLYNIKIICEDCVKKDPTNSHIEIAIGQLNEFEKQSFYIHFFQWEFSSIWSKEVDEAEQCEGCSQVIGFTTPDSSDQQDFNFQETFRGDQPTVVSILLTPTFYQNMIDEIELTGYRAHLQNIEKGQTVNYRQAMKIDNQTLRQTIGHSEVNDQFKIQFQMSLSSNIYQIRVIQLKNILEALAEVMGFLAGFSFIARFSKHILVANKVGKIYDKQIEDHMAKVQQIKNDKMSEISLSSSPKKNVDIYLNGVKQVSSQRREASTSPYRIRNKAASEYDANLQFGLNPITDRNKNKDSQFKRKKYDKNVADSEQSPEKESNLSVRAPERNQVMTRTEIPQQNQKNKFGSDDDDEIEDNFKIFYGDLRHKRV